MDETIITNMITPLKKGDELYFLGDMAFDIASAGKFFTRLSKGIKFFWILGNHERTAKQYKHYCIQQTPMKEIRIQKNPITLCHYPIGEWDRKHYGAWHLHGHSHNNYQAEGKILDVGVDSAIEWLGEYRPFSLSEVIEIMDSK